jgi:hypothetical protein
MESSYKFMVKHVQLWKVAFHTTSPRWVHCFYLAALASFYAKYAGYFPFTAQQCFFKKKILLECFIVSLTALAICVFRSYELLFFFSVVCCFLGLLIAHLIADFCNGSAVLSLSTRLIIYSREVLLVLDISP